MENKLDKDSISSEEVPEHEEQEPLESKAPPIDFLWGYTKLRRIPVDGNNVGRTGRAQELGMFFRHYKERYLAIIK